MGQNSGSLTTTGSVSLGANKVVTDTLVGIQLQGTYGTVTGVIEGLFPVQPGASPVWAPLAAQDASTGAVVSGTISPSDNTTRIFYANGAGLSDVRWRATAVGSGTLYVALSSGSYLGLPSFLTQNNSTLGATTVSTLHATGAITADSSVLSNSASAGIGYSAGAGGAVTQGTGRTTTVVLSKTTGAITLFSAAGSATPFTFTVTNTTVAATDTILVSQKSGTDAYSAVVSAVAAGSFKLTITDLTGTTTEQPVFNFVVIKGVAS